MKPALIVFVRNPVKGQVKTRIAKTMGDEKALEVYNKLLAHTKAITQQLHADVHVFYADGINPDDQWNDAPYIKQTQQGNQLGERMKHAFEQLFTTGYQKVLIIGSDCFELTNELIVEAINMLDEVNLVIGPTIDGGYYLLGMNSFVPQLFDGKQWSTDTVLMDTLRDIEQTDLTLHTLPLLSDVDTEEDCKRYAGLLS